MPKWRNFSDKHKGKKSLVPEWPPPEARAAHARDECGLADGHPFHRGDIARCVFNGDAAEAHMQVGQEFEVGECGYDCIEVGTIGSWSACRFELVRRA